MASLKERQMMELLLCRSWRESVVLGHICIYVWSPAMEEILALEQEETVTIKAYEYIEA